MKPGLVSVILPTTGRPGRAEACVRRLLDTTAGHAVEVICPVDADPATRAVLEPLATVLYADAYRGKAKAWNDGLTASAGEFIVFAADDLQWGDGWLDAALLAMATLPEGGGVVGFNDMHRNGRKEATHFMASRWFIIHYGGGVLAVPCYASFCHDSEMCYRANEIGRYAWAEDCHVEHIHYASRGRLFDATDKRWRDCARVDMQAFNQRRKNGFTDDWEPVIVE